MDNAQLFTWEALSTMGGASLLTYFVVQYFKAMIDKYFPHLPTDLFAVFVAFIILTPANIATGADPSDWRIYPLAAANAFLVAATAGHVNNKALNPPGVSSSIKESETNV